MKLMGVFVVILAMWRACAMDCLPKDDLIQSGIHFFLSRKL